MMTPITVTKQQPLRGVVVSSKMDKTVVVLIETKVKHPLYHKFMVKRKKIVAHDETNQCVLGATVLVSQTKPISKTKSWIVQAIVQN